MRIRAVLLCLLSAACAPAIHSAVFMDPPPRSNPPDHPVLFYQTSRPECPYEEIGTVTARKSSALVSMGRVAEGVRAHARRMGGDAVIAQRERSEVDGVSLIAHAVIDVDRVPVVTATVIRFRDKGCMR